MNEEIVRLDSGNMVSVHTARLALLTMEHVLGLYGWVAIENLRAICAGKCDRFHGANADPLAAEFVDIGILIVDGVRLVPGSDDVRDIIASCIRGSGKKIRIARPKRMPPPSRE